MPGKESCWERWSPGKFLQRVRGREEETSGKCWPLLKREGVRVLIWLKWYEDSNLPLSLKIASLWWSPPYWVPLYRGLAELIWRQFPAHQLCIISAPPHSPKYPSKNQKKKISLFSAKQFKRFQNVLNHFRLFLLVFKYYYSHTCCRPKFGDKTRWNFPVFFFVFNAT